VKITVKEFTPFVMLAVDWDLFPVEIKKFSKSTKNHLRKLKFCFLHPGLPLFQMPTVEL
jgi:hypothetical protein